MFVHSYLPILANIIIGCVTKSGQHYYVDCWDCVMTGFEFGLITTSLGLIDIMWNSPKGKYLMFAYWFNQINSNLKYFNKSIKSTLYT